MGTSLQQLTESAKLAEQIEAGSVVVDLDPGSIDSSFVSDRIADATDPSLDALVESMRQSGQQVPILVRPHPTATGRYQVAYGHRRLRAAERLGINVRAVVRSLSDQELVVAQGKENLERRDLSFIEKAFFALHLETLDFERAVIGSALSTDKGDLSRYLAVAKAVPENIAKAIGPAPKAGRARWLALVDALSKGKSKAVDRLIEDPGFQGQPTDQRFALLLAAATRRTAAREPDRQDWTDDTGRKVARIERSDTRFTLSIDERLEPAFGDYLLARLPEILAAFRSGEGERNP
jgi:ParB family chromosome partitioning protein